MQNSQILRNFRKSKCMTLQEFANFLDVGTSTVVYWDRGERPIANVVVSYLNEKYSLGLKATENRQIPRSDFWKEYKGTILKFEKSSVPLGKYTCKDSEGIYQYVHSSKNKGPKKNTKTKRTRVSVPTIQSISGLDCFGKRLYSIRVLEGLSLVAFAKKYDLSYTQLHKLELGEAITLRITTLRRLRKAGYSIDWLLGEEF